MTKTTNLQMVLDRHEARLYRAESLLQGLERLYAHEAQASAVRTDVAAPTPLRQGTELHIGVRQYIELRQQVGWYGRSYPTVEKKLQKCRSRKAVLAVALELINILKADVQIKKGHVDIIRDKMCQQANTTRPLSNGVKSVLFVAVIIKLTLIGWFVWGGM